jgi:hypothetical protein
MTGVLALSPAITADVAGRPAIAECVSRYCWGYDERRRDILEECFSEDAVWEGNVCASQAVGPIEGRDAIVEWLAGFWPHQHEQRRHMLMNTLVTQLSEAEAEVHTYLLLLSARTEKVRLETSGFYRVGLSRVDERWRIRSLFAGFDAPFWPGKIENLSNRARRRHGLFGNAD